MEFSVYRLQLVSLFAFVFFAFGATAVAEDWSPVFEKSKASIPLLFMSSGYCSGALIEPDLILTAAHCVDRLRPVRVAWSEALPKIEATKNQESILGQPANSPAPKFQFLTEGARLVAMDRDGIWRYCACPRKSPTLRSWSQTRLRPRKLALPS